MDRVYTSMRAQLGGDILTRAQDIKAKRGARRVQRELGQNVEEKEKRDKGEGREWGECMMVVTHASCGMVCICNMRLL